MKLRVLNISRQVDSAELKEIFQIHGEVVEATIVMDEKTKASKGFGFIEMKDEEAGQAAIEKLHGAQVGNQRIRVKIVE